MSLLRTEILGQIEWNHFFFMRNWDGMRAFSDHPLDMLTGFASASTAVSSTSTSSANVSVSEMALVEAPTSTTSADVTELDDDVVCAGVMTVLLDTTVTDTAAGAAGANWMSVLCDATTGAGAIIPGGDSIGDFTTTSTGTTATAGTAEGAITTGATAASATTAGTVTLVTTATGAVAATLAGTVTPCDTATDATVAAETTSLAGSTALPVVAISDKVDSGSGALPGNFFGEMESRDRRALLLLAPEGAAGERGAAGLGSVLGAESIDISSAVFFVLAGAGTLSVTVGSKGVSFLLLFLLPFCSFTAL